MFSDQIEGFRPSQLISFFKSRTLSLRARLSGFGSNASGSVPLLAVLGLMASFGVVAITLDHARGLTTAIKLQQALDAALQSGAQAPAGQDPAAVAARVFEAAYFDTYARAKEADFRIDPSSGALTGRAVARMPNLFSGWRRMSEDIAVSGTMGRTGDAYQQTSAGFAAATLRR